MRKMLAVALASFGIAVAYATPASADLIFSLSVDGCAGGCSSPGIPPFGSITLHQVDANTVQVTESLVSGVEFVSTGAGDAIVFNVAKAITLSNISAGFTLDLTTPPIHVGFFGDFDYGIHCTGCGNGSSNPLPGPLLFTAADGSGLSITDFIANSGGYFFAADIVNENVPGSTKPTGNVGATGPTTRLPEPGTLGLVGVMLAGFAIRRRKQA